ncbi:universal stress protein [Nesterenkonia sphaerica]|uniref:Universal stress protein n=1 Tax=Nesterenkonia sphaerica TaxID=1804988 RepID=A0A5R9AGG9_9MICC|nr:universal stress protein [Nesterenkonia sphaerica]TLP76926.1 universal stress protein [Nesterenkonia sphaerica]
MLDINGSLGVLVGFDGSDHAIRALQWGACEALRQDVRVTVITAFTVPRMIPGDTEASVEVANNSMARQGAEQTLAEAREILRDFPGEATFHVEYGDAAGVLVAHSSSAELVVVGARGRGGFVGRVLGSVASALPAHAACPTVVVDRNYEFTSTNEDPWISSDQRPIAIGMDSSRGSKYAALKAAEMAVRHGVPLRMVMSVPPLDGALMWYPELGPRYDERERRHNELEDRLQVIVRWISEHFEHLVISCAVVDGLPVEVLQEETRNAQLTVVGTRGRGGLASALLGSTSSSLLMHAAGPVMVVPEDEDPRMPGDDHAAAHAPLR